MRFSLSPAISTDPYAVNTAIYLGRSDYGRGWSGEATGIDSPFIEPEDLLRESYANPTPQRHWVRLDQPWFDDERWPMGSEYVRMPIGATMPTGSMEPLDDYRLVYDGAHA